MPGKIISRNLYDVRFLEIPKDEKTTSIESYIDSQIHSIYPGNNGAYEWIYRLFDESTAIIVFITKEILAEYSAAKPIVPVFLLISVKKSITSDNIYIYQGDFIEKILFENKKPVRSIMLPFSSITDADYNAGNWLFVVKPEDDIASSAFEIKLPRFSEQHRFKDISSSQTLSYKGFYIMLLILLVFISGISFRYSQILKEEISEHRILQNRFMMFSNKKTIIEENISKINERIESASINELRNPYELLDALYNSVGSIIRIQRISIQEDSFSIECISRDPIEVSDTLSKNPLFEDVSIQRIQNSDEGFKFSLSGSFNG